MTSRRRPWRTAAFVMVALGLLPVSLSACAEDSDVGGVTAAPDLSGVDVTVGWVGDDDLDVLVGELYSQALEARGATVAQRRALADHQDAIEQLQAGAVSVVTERSHALLAGLTAPAEPEAKTMAEQLDALRDALPAGLAVLTPSSAHDSEVVACRRAVVDKYELSTRTDLELLMVDRPGEVDDDDCRTLAAPDPEIARDELVTLIDDELDTPIDAITPLVTTSAATPELQATLDAVSSTLEPATLPVLLAEVQYDGGELSDVVADWLEAVDLA